MKREKKFLHSQELILNFLIYDNNNNNDRLTASDPGQPG